VPAGGKESFLARLEQVPAEERRSFAHHTVRKGETLSTIAGRYSVSMSELQSANRIANANKIYPGMNLVIPSKTAALPQALTSTAGSGSTKASASAPEAAPKAKSSSSSSGRTQTLSHVVRKGETLSGIAARYGVSAADLQSWNGLRNANHVMVGQSLKVQAKASASASTKSSSAAAVHVVRKGDTLSAIAARYDLSLEQLKRLNGIKGSHIEVGQKLKVRG
jgi:membrane-bound lytic murein transglycosylase D